MWNQRQLLRTELGLIDSWRLKADTQYFRYCFKHTSPNMFAIWPSQCNIAVNNNYHFDSMVRNIVTALFDILSISQKLLPCMITKLLLIMVKTENIMTILWQYSIVMMCNWAFVMQRFVSKAQGTSNHQYNTPVHTFNFDWFVPNLWRQIVWQILLKSLKSNLLTDT